MSRIRTIKPEFWTSSQVAECTRDARLLFIGMWNFCDDAGRHVASTKRLKMEVFPGDNLGDAEVTQMVTQLVRVGLIEEYAVDGVTYWQVTGWKHQKIDKPNVKHPDRNGDMTCSTPRRLGGKQRQLAYKKLCELHGEKCGNCGNPRHLTVDHKIALNNGGTNEIENLQLLCKTCNSEKRDKMKWGGGLTPENEVRGTQGDACVPQGDALVTRPRMGGESIKTPPYSPPRERRGAGDRPGEAFAGFAGLPYESLVRILDRTTHELVADHEQFADWLLACASPGSPTIEPQIAILAQAMTATADAAAEGGSPLELFRKRIRDGTKAPREVSKSAWEILAAAERRRAQPPEGATRGTANGQPDQQHPRSSKRRSPGRKPPAEQRRRA